MARRKRTRAREGEGAIGTGTKVGAGAVTVVAGAVIVFLILGGKPALDPKTMCPEKGAEGDVTVLLIDPSTPLTGQHRSELRRLLRELGTEGTRMTVGVGQELVAYHLGAVEEATDTGIQPVDAFCNPGGRPSDRTLTDDLTEGRLHAQARWRQWEERLEALFPAEDAGGQGTPLIETLKVISARHAHSARHEEGRRMHLILWSDLLQNSPWLTQYTDEPLGSGKDWARDPKHKHLRSDMRGVDVSVFRLERPEHEEVQTDEHFQWWTEWLLDMGATIRWQESI